MKRQWEKTGGVDKSLSAVYRSGPYEVIRVRIAGIWTRPALYLNGRYVATFHTVAEAKKAAG